QHKPGAENMTNKRTVTRRGFLGTTGATAGAVMATGAFGHPAIGRVIGANDRLNFVIIGPGGRAQAHIGVLLDMKKEGKEVDIVGVADVWDGGPTKFSKDGKPQEERGLFPSAKRAGLDLNNKEAVTKDYRRLLDRKDVHACVIATPDHWHAKQTIDS